MNEEVEEGGKEEEKISMCRRKEGSKREGEGGKEGINLFWGGLLAGSLVFLFLK